MSEFKFACPSCNQRIAADPAWSGQQIQCPACKAQITVPGAPAAASQAPAPPTPPPKGRLSVSSHAPAAPAPKPPSDFPEGGHPLPMRKPAGSSAGKTAGIAIVCLVVAAGAVFAVMKVRAQRADAAAKKAEAEAVAAKEAATAAAATAAAAAAENASKTNAAKSVAAAAEPAANPAFSAATRRAIADAEARYGKATQTPSADEGVAPDPSQIPETPVAGTVQNEAFKITSATYQAGWLTLGEGSGAIPERSVKFNLYVPSTESIEGRTFKRPDPKERRPLTVQPKGKRMAGASATAGYALQMEFGNRQGNQIPGKLYLSIPGTVTNQIAGTFKVDLK